MPRLTHEGRALLMSLLAGLPGSLISLIILWTNDYTPKVQWTLTVLIAAFWLGFSFSLRDRIVYPLQTLANLLAALREGDYSIRGRGAGATSALTEVMVEVNALGGTLREQRLGALEATNLLRKVMAEIDVAVFAFDQEQCLRLANRAGERLLGQPSERLLGRSATELGLQRCLNGEETRTEQMTFPGGMGRLEMRRSSFREHGMPHQLVVLSDLTKIGRAHV